MVKEIYSKEEINIPMAKSLQILCLVTTNQEFVVTNPPNII
jgi:hypothetical protein